MLLPFSLMLAHSASGTLSAPYPYRVTIGAAPPKLRVGRWLKNGPVPIFERGKVYVVDSWASWCEPCRAAMPHLSELQDQYRNRLIVLGVDVLEQKAADGSATVASMGDKLSYTLLADSIPAGKGMNDGAFVRDWLEGSGKYSAGLPLTFIIDSSGKIAWIGHPSDLDSPLKSVLSGTWNLPAEKKKYESGMRISALSEPYKVAYYHAMDANDGKGVANQVVKIIRVDPKENASWIGRGFDSLLGDLKSPAAARYFAASLLSNFPKNEMVLTRLAGNIFKAPNIDPALLNIGVQASEKAYGDGTRANYGTTMLRGMGLCLSGKKVAGLQLLNKAGALAKTPAQTAQIEMFKKRFGG